jgi:hypothetical protein
VDLAKVLPRQDHVAVADQPALARVVGVEHRVPGVVEQIVLIVPQGLEDPLPGRSLPGQMGHDLEREP